MNAWQQLEAVKGHYKRMKDAEQLLLRMKERAESTTRMLLVDKVKGSKQNRSEDATIDLIEARDLYGESISQYLNAFESASKIIGSLSDPEWIRILSARYIRLLSWSKIAAETGNSSRKCMLINKKASELLQTWETGE